MPPLAREPDGALIAGVLNGLARWLGWDVTMVRIVFVLCSLLSVAFPGIIIYLVMWLLMPTDKGFASKDVGTGTHGTGTHGTGTQ